MKLFESKSITEAYLKMCESREVSFYEEVMYDKAYVDVEDVLSEFDSDKAKGIRQKNWDLIPAAQYKNLLDSFMAKGPELFRCPESTLDEWLTLICRNIGFIEIITELAGHSQWFPSNEVSEHYIEYLAEKGIEDLDDYEQGSNFLESIGFYDWCKLPDGSDAWSDYGLKPLYNIVQTLPANASLADKLIAINRCLDIVHCRGDLASAFIEGGSASCSRISND